MIKILELFAGIGACSKALERLGIEHEIVDAVEIDKYAVASFNAIHNTNFEPQDITTWDKDIEVDLIMHGSPCQDFSLAGKQAGGDEGTGTRSSLMYETIRIVTKLKPKYVIWENVKNLLSKKHRHNFDAYLEAMEQLGYNNYYQVLNAKDYGIPQNRERVFTISILGNDNYDFPKKEELKTLPIDLIETNADSKYDLTEKNIKLYQREFGSKGKELNLFEPIPTLTASMGTGGGNIPYFTFPPKQELKLKLKDMLEDEVDERYYLSEKTIRYITDYDDVAKNSGRNIDNKLINSNIAKTICCRGVETNQRADISNFIIDGLNEEIHVKKLKQCLYNDTDVVLLKRGYPVEVKPEKDNVDDVDIIGNYSKSEYGATPIVNKNGLVPTVRENHGQVTAISTDLRIRKLTPKTCWRLMGFDDEDYEKAAKVNSNTQLYKQAGNSIVVNVLEAILTNLLLKQLEFKGQLSIFDLN